MKMPISSDRADLKISTVETATLIPDPDNVREHTGRNHEAIVRSIQRFGIRKPIVVHEGSNIVYAGNETLNAALEIGMEEIPVAWIPAATSPEVCKAYAIADNRTNDLSEFDLPKLGELALELDALPDLDLQDLGFTKESIEAMLGQFDIDPTDVVALPEGERSVLQQMTFTLSDCQVEEVKRALGNAKGRGPFVDTGNENSNGNALARIAEAYSGTG